MQSEINAILTETLVEHAPSYATFKNWVAQFNLLIAQLNPICHLLALLGAHHILHVSRIRVKLGDFSTFFPWSG
jgi:hypothetical protein